jgi:hypothetical protein
MSKTLPTSKVVFAIVAFTSTNAEAFEAAEAIS